MPDRLAARPEYLDQPRIGTIAEAAEALPGPRPAVWAEALQPIAAMHHTAVHGEISRGQFLVDEQRQVTGIVDWDGLHIGHPLLDLDFGVDLYRIYAPAADRNRLRQRIWTAYVCSRTDALPDWRCVRLLWALLDATTLMREHDSRLPAALHDLDAATGELG